MHCLIKRVVAQVCLASSAIALFTLALALLVSAGLPNRADYTGSFIPEIGYVAPEIDAFAPPFTAQTLSGDSLNLWSLRGKPVIINFWATWCEPCRAEMPQLQTLYDQYHPQGLEILAVNLGEAPATMQAWVTETGISYPIVRDERLSIAHLYVIRGQPTTYILAPNGKITHIFFGATTAEQLETVIEFSP